MKHVKKQAGITAIELVILIALVAIAIIGTLTSFGAPFLRDVIH